jgi:L-cysteine desulfidase
VGEDAQPQIEEFLRTVPISVSCADTPCPLDIAITGHSKEHSACVRIANNHTNIVYMEKDGGVLAQRPLVSSPEDHLTDKRCLNVEDIVRFAIPWIFRFSNL